MRSATAARLGVVARRERLDAQRRRLGADAPIAARRAGEVAGSLARLRIGPHHARARGLPRHAGEQPRARGVVRRDARGAEAEPLRRFADPRGRDRVQHRRAVAFVGAVHRARQEHRPHRALRVGARRGQRASRVVRRGDVPLERGAREQLASLALQLAVEPRRVAEDSLDLGPSAPRGGGSGADEPHGRARAARRAQRGREQQRRAPGAPGAHHRIRAERERIGGKRRGDAAREVHRRSPSPPRVRPSVCAHAADAHVQRDRDHPGAMSHATRRVILRARSDAAPRLCALGWTPSGLAGTLPPSPTRPTRRITMSWQSISLPHLGVVTVVAFGALARAASAQQAVGEFTEHGDVGTVTRRRLGVLRLHDRRVPARRLGREHVGRARRVPLRVAQDEGRLHPHGARTARRQGRGPAPQVRVDDPALARLRGSPHVERRGARRRPHLAAVPAHAGRRRPSRWSRRSGRRTSSSSSGAAATYIMSVAQVRRHARPRVQATDIALGDDGVRRAVRLRAQRHGDRSAPRSRDVRITVPAPRRLRPLPRVHRQQRRDPGRRDRPRGGSSTARRLRAGAQLDARRQGADLQRRTASSIASTSRRGSRRRSTPAPRSATTTTTCCRSTARCSASATRATARAATSRSSTSCRPTAGRRGASRRWARRTCTAGRPTAKWLVYTGIRDGDDRHL